MSVSRPETGVLPDIVNALHELADASAAQIMPLFRTRLDIANKDENRFDPVTAADKAAEAAIRDILLKRFPDHGIIGEEYGSHQPDARFTWVIDPIDGTRAFIQGLPVWGTLIAFMENGRPVCGMMNQPFTRERYWSDGASSYYRRADEQQTKIQTRQSPLGDAQMATTDPYLFRLTSEANGFNALKDRVRQCRYGTDCYAYMLLASGHIDIVLESGLQLYDVAAVIPIIEHAGGCATTWNGGSAAEGGQLLACGDPALHAQIVEILADASQTA